MEHLAVIVPCLVALTGALWLRRFVRNGRRSRRRPTENGYTALIVHQLPHDEPKHQHK